MNKIYKIIAYLAVSCFLSWLSYSNENSFFIGFNNIVIPLLATLLAINITTSSLIAGELRKIQTANPNSKIKDAKYEIKRIFKTQLFLICSLLGLFIIKDCSLIVEYIEQKYIDIAVNACVVGVFIYFLEIIYDLGCSLFDIINHNSSSQS